MVPRAIRRFFILVPALPGDVLRRVIVRARGKTGEVDLHRVMHRKTYRWGHLNGAVLQL